jgi:hypothetical protein
MTLKTFSIMTSTKQQNDIMTISIVTFASVMIPVKMKLRIMTPCKTALITMKEIQHTPKLQSCHSCKNYESHHCDTQVNDTPKMN